VIRCSASPSSRAFPVPRLCIRIFSHNLLTGRPVREYTGYKPSTYCAPSSFFVATSAQASRPCCAARGAPWRNSPESRSETLQSVAADAIATNDDLTQMLLVRCSRELEKIAGPGDDLKVAWRKVIQRAEAEG